MKEQGFDKAKDRLGQLFEQLPDRSLPTDIRLRLMQRVVQESERKMRRQTWKEWLWIVSASLLMVALAAFGWRFWEIPKLDLPQIEMPFFVFYSFIGAMALLLLLFDYHFRRWYYKKHSSKPN